MAKSRLHELSEVGQSVWVDSISRTWLLDGTLERFISDDAVVGVTSNPTIFDAAISRSDVYDDQLRELFEREPEAKEVFVQLAAQDVRDACAVLRGVWDQENGRDGYVSFEVDPTLAYDRDGQYEEAKRLHALVDRPNLFVKIPATKPGLGAIEDSIADGRSINVTLTFSLQRYREVTEAYIRGLERLVEAGGDPAPIVSVASFFVSRVDTEADKRLDGIGGHDELKGKLAIANAKLAYQEWQRIFAGERWEALASRGATKQRCLWASTSTKNPAYSDVLYVEKLIGPETVNTMPEETIRAFQDHGRAAPTLEEGIDEARRILEQLAEAGVDYDDVTDTLEREGVEKFSASFTSLLDTIEAKRGQLVPA
jgi:transaldolase